MEAFRRYLAWSESTYLVAKQTATMYYHCFILTNQMANYPDLANLSLWKKTDILWFPTEPQR